MSHIRSVGTGLFLAAGLALASDVVVLRGGSRIDLKQPWVQQGSNAILTRADGTLLSVPVTEIDTRATAAARSSGPVAARPAVVAPPSTPADAVRSGREPRARVRVTDADVGHSSMIPVDEVDKTNGAKAGPARVEVGDYKQQKAGTNLLLTGNVVNTGTETVTGTRMTVSGIDEAGNAVTSANAIMAGGTIEGGQSANFTVTLPVGDKTINHFRFTPTWSAPPAAAPPAAVAAAAAASAAASAGASGAPATAPAPASSPPAPRPTPYGQGSLYAAPAGSAPSTAPADGKSGYIPGAANPDLQPKPPQ
ncbi:MAG: hypothetical protein ABI592_01565 [Acidobacteriota bacterium]